MKAFVVLVVFGACLLTQGAGAASQWNYDLRPTCRVKNPPDQPHVIAGQIMHGEIVQRCDGPVWRMGNYACLAARIAGKQAWRLVWCEANEVYFQQGMTLNVEDYVKPMKGAIWQWRMTGYVWVDYEPGPGGLYRYQVNSPPTVASWRPDQRVTR